MTSDMGYSLYSPIQEGKVHWLLHIIRGAVISKIFSVYYTSKLRGRNFITDTPSIIRGEAEPG
jgi:hypothetical protein